MLALRKINFFPLATLALLGGCAATEPSRSDDMGPLAPAAEQFIASPAPSASTARIPQAADVLAHEIVPSTITLVAHQQYSPADALAELEQRARDRNPRLTRLYHEYQSAVAKSQYVDKLPDPRFGVNAFGNALETASGSQRANMAFSQAVPWLARLRADEQRAVFDAYAIHAELEAEALRVQAAVRTSWYRLYVLARQIEIAEANQQLLKSLIDVANARIATGAASQGDVLLGTLELSQLEERLLTYRRQRQGVEAELNRLTAQPAGTHIASPQTLSPILPEANAEQMTLVALQNQPEIEAAQMRTQASRWGVEVARLMRRPEFVLSASYYPTDNNRPPSTIVDVGQDPWALGAQVSIPIWREKYDAIENEAKWKHQAAHNSVEELTDRYEALIVDLLAEAHRAHETAMLYQATILPQARQTLAADQEAYSNGTVEFDRVIRDYRSLLTLEVGYHQAIGDLATSLAKLSQAAGQDIALTGLPGSN
ncbi:TolC family protein [Bremerella cremea]|uniref:TolC family protein n=1 Tax=Bremerella cremea TaxID=1031537 RepID=A0A368KPX7_9BACT|nr:TolC family protein [Bremerella cremea]RCS47681.1 TolC family protein [Bremerella cremea]